MIKQVISYIIECNDCGETTSDALTKVVAIEIAEDEDWLIVSDDIHYCPDCKDDYLKTHTNG